MAYLFNGTNQALKMSDATFTLQTTHSVSLWFKGTHAASKALFGVVEGFRQIALDTFASNTIRWNYEGTDDVRAGSTSLAALFDNAWHHFAITFGPAGAIKFYLDGVLVTPSVSGVVPPALSFTTANRRPAIMARNNGGTLDQFKSGEFCELALYNGVALTLEQAQALANGIDARDVELPSLFGYWPLRDDLSDLISANNLTAVGSPTVSEHPFAAPSAGATPGFSRDTRADGAAGFSSRYAGDVASLFFGQSNAA